MEFENVNNFNLALEAANKKQQKKLKLTTLVHRLKKLLKRVKPNCTKKTAKTQEELDNEQNEILERKLYNYPANTVITSNERQQQHHQQYIPDQDLKLFRYTTQYQVAQKQFYHQ